MNKIYFQWLIPLLLVLLPSFVLSGELIGKVKGTRGMVTIQREGKTKPAFPDDPVYLSDTIITGSNGAIGILLEDNTLISMGPIGRLSMDKFTFAPAKNKYELRLHMIHGTFVYQSGLLGKLAPHAVTLDTPVGPISMLKPANINARFPK